MSQLLFQALDERLSRVHTILSELVYHHESLSDPALQAADEAEGLMNEARTILCQGEAYLDQASAEP